MRATPVRSAEKHRFKRPQHAPAARTRRMRKPNARAACPLHVFDACAAPTHEPSAAHTLPRKPCPSPPPIRHSPPALRVPCPCTAHYLRASAIPAAPAVHRHPRRTRRTPPSIRRPRTNSAPCALCPVQRIICAHPPSPQHPPHSACPAPARRIICAHPPHFRDNF